LNGPFPGGGNLFLRKPLDPMRLLKNIEYFLKQSGLQPGAHGVVPQPAAVAVAAWLFLSMTRVGRGLYAVGGNPVAARYCGIDLAPQEIHQTLLIGDRLGHVVIGAG
jgi:ABC-type uncharacterized transport system permease subunit